MKFLTWRPCIHPKHAGRVRKWSGQIRATPRMVGRGQASSTQRQSRSRESSLRGSQSFKAGGGKRALWVCCRLRIVTDDHAGLRVPAPARARDVPAAPLNPSSWGFTRPLAPPSLSGVRARATHPWFLGLRNSPFRALHGGLKQSCLQRSAGCKGQGRSCWAK